MLNFLKKSKTLNDKKKRKIYLKFIFSNFVLRLRNWIAETSRNLFSNTRTHFSLSLSGYNFNSLSIAALPSLLTSLVDITAVPGASHVQYNSKM